MISASDEARLVRPNSCFFCSLLTAGATLDGVEKPVLVALEYPDEPDTDENVPTEKDETEEDEKAEVEEAVVAAAGAAAAAAAAEVLLVVGRLLELWPLLLDALVPSKEETLTLFTLLPVTAVLLVVVVVVMMLLPIPVLYGCPGAPLHRMGRSTDGGFVSVGSTGRTITLSMELSRVLKMLPVALPAVLLMSFPPRVCFFFLAKSYMSPKMPANVLRRFFIVSSASSTTDGPPAALAGGALPAPDRAAEADEMPDTLLDWDAGWWRRANES
uniref:Uncharacterized protein n=1 Tax=Anopheles maculatus TaxID=74869 RepID=A0A182SAT5_9DIPT